MMPKIGLYLLSANPSFGMTMSKILNDVFLWHVCEDSILIPKTSTLLSQDHISLNLGLDPVCDMLSPQFDHYNFDHTLNQVEKDALVQSLFFFECTGPPSGTRLYHRHNSRTKKFEMKI